jgi:hypothetical protein
MSLQRLQDTDLLYRVLERQQRLAKERFGNGSDTSTTDTMRSSASDQPASDSAQASVVSTTSSEG